MFWIAVLCFAACVIADPGGAKESRDVKTTQGIVRGYKDPTFGVYEFYGIPYATAPTGKDRYRAPLAGQIWLGILEATNKKIICPQNIEQLPGLTEMIMQQDCLIANVFVPDTDETNLAVVVYIHGGSFVLGYGSMMTHNNFIKNRKAIFVNFNYRLGALGFLCLGTKQAPGNAGLKDQVALLRWVKANIANFGGNPEDITVAGSSAGSMSTDLLLLSKTTDGLFTKIIPESGSHLSSFAVYTDPIRRTKEFAQRYGFFDVDNIEALEEFYINAPWEQLLDPVIMPANGSAIFSPCVERNVGEEMILTDAPYNIIKKGDYKKIPMLYGLASSEGLLMSWFFEEYSKAMNENFASVLPADLKFPTEAERNEVAKTVKEFYFKDKTVNYDTFASYIDYLSDTYFLGPLIRSIKLHVEAGHKEIYLYEYAYVDKTNPILLPPSVPNHVKETLGAYHSAQSDAAYTTALFTVDESQLSEEFREVKSIVRELWYNFIVSKKPVTSGSNLPSWPPVDSEGSPHMVIDKQLELKGRLHKERMELWNNIYDKYYNIPSPPSTTPSTQSGASFCYLHQSTTVILLLFYSTLLFL